MNKLKTAVLYECSTKIKPMCIFYLIQYAITGLIFAVVALSVGDGNVGSNCLEFSSVVFVCVLGVLGYHEDLKALSQNGFTRRYIYGATICMFLFISALMAFIDTLIGNSLHYFVKGYFTLYGGLYGYGDHILNWLMLTVWYLSFCLLAYLCVLTVRKLGKLASTYLAVGLGGLILLVTALFRFVLEAETVRAIGRFFQRAMGFMPDGGVNLLFPLLSFITVSAVFALISYAIILRTEIK